MRDDIGAKHQLKNYSLISIRTVMIGVLEILEEYYEEEIKEDPERWADVREAILQRGEDSMEIMSEHFNKYNVSRKNIYIPFKKGFRE